MYGGMTTRLLAAAALAAAATLAPALPATAAASPVGACTSLAACTTGCSGFSVIRVTVIGPGTGTASCGGGTASCTSVSATGTCTRAALSTYGSSNLYCGVKSGATAPAVAICTVEPSVD
jgi:hypothetical protein